MSLSLKACIPIRTKESNHRAIVLRKMAAANYLFLKDKYQRAPVCAMIFGEITAGLR
jgi:hypothetical protein